jgi:ABC-2 type transport system permease protein
MIKYELIRVARNKVVFTMLLLFCTALLLVLSYVQMNTKSFPIAVYTDGVEIKDANVMNVINENMDTSRITYVDSREEGLKLIRNNKVTFFICLDKGSEKDEITAIFYYDQSNVVARSTASGLVDAKNKYAYDTISNFLLQYGISINESYFELISFEPASGKSISIRQMPFAMEVATCVSLVLMLGLAYSLARDNETQVSKNISYLPIGINKYLLSKIFPYFLLGIFQLILMLVLGSICFGIKFEINIFAIVGLSLIFIISVLTLSSLISTSKSQIAAIFLDMLIILLPLFISTVVYVQACPMYIQVILNCLPMTPFIVFLNALIYNGVVLWRYVFIFIAQTIVYYFFAQLILKKRART